MSQRWTIGGVATIVSDDTDWKADMKVAELQVIGANFSMYQLDGYRTPQRDIKGWIMSKSQSDQLDTLFKTAMPIIIVDDQGRSYSCYIVKFAPERVFDIKNYELQKFDMSFIMAS